jgi:hypothetical protein
MGPEALHIRLEVPGHNRLLDQVAPTNTLLDLGAGMERDETAPAEDRLDAPAPTRHRFLDENALVENRPEAVESSFELGGSANREGFPESPCRMRP